MRKFSSFVLSCAAFLPLTTSTVFAAGEVLFVKNDTQAEVTVAIQGVGHDGYGEDGKFQGQAFRDLHYTIAPGNVLSFKKEDLRREYQDNEPHQYVVEAIVGSRALSKTVYSGAHDAEYPLNISTLGMNID